MPSLTPEQIEQRKGGRRYRATTVRGVWAAAHVAIVERVLGRKLPKGAQVHHVDGDGRNNAHSNLVVCPDATYHRLLHKRADALEACGHADWRRCRHCKRYAPTEQLSFSGNYAYHRNCNATYELWRKAHRRAEQCRI